MLPTPKFAIWLLISALATTLALGVPNTVQYPNIRDVDAVFIKDAPIVVESEE
ncbi:uncharacterized protein F4822DRAFT_423566 [Hypoxylon trugodes]|uniref:uncharacterized protein n=1 Tax=Hypoxylon trugodes TaxID=326681 RepID=UPI0021A138CE|nr:uncharacterized protein F4822DRAFT_423566 [Hypoxylon trugodes]KAI1393102.1 hypothetical protein F4822DRAFT_423566 [Hypoxylon trugodes]